MQDDHQVPRTAKLVVGRRRCGKSAWAERVLSTVPSRIYIGMLPATPETAATIEAHRTRRGDGWTLVELAGLEVPDLTAVRLALRAAPRPTACLIDGLTTWADRLGDPSGDVIAAAFIITEHIVDFVLSEPDVTWWLIDVLPESLAEEGFVVHALACRLIQSRLRAHIDGLQFQVFAEETP